MYFFLATSSSESIVDGECILGLFQPCCKCKRRCTTKVRGLMLDITQKCCFCQSYWKLNRRTTPTAQLRWRVPTQWTGSTVRYENHLNPLSHLRVHQHSGCSDTNLLHTDFYLQVLVYFKTIMFGVLVENYKTSNRIKKKKLSDYHRLLVTRERNSKLDQKSI